VLYQSCYETLNKLRNKKLRNLCFHAGDDFNRLIQKAKEKEKRERELQVNFRFKPSLLKLQKLGRFKVNKNVFLLQETT
jgi:hypothetical protein